MNKINFLSPNKDNLYTYLYTGIFLFFISFLDVFLNSFFKINLTSFLPGLISFILPLVLGFIGLHLIRIEYSGIRQLDLLNKHINTNSFNAILSLLIIFVFAFALVNSQEVMHINFDDINPTATFESWNNSSTFTLTTNPIPDPVNASLNVGLFTAGNDNGIGIGISNNSSVFPNPFNFTESNLFKIKFLAGEPVTITLKIENQPDWGAHNSETSATYDAA